MLDVRARWGGNVRAYVGALEALIIETLGSLGVEAHTRSGLVGVWVRRRESGREREAKIAAIGVRLGAGSARTASASTWRRTCSASRTVAASASTG